MTAIATPAPSTLGEMAAAFPDTMPAVQQIGALLGAIVPGSPMVLMTRETNGKVFTFSPRSSIGEVAAMLGDALGTRQGEIAPMVTWPVLKVSFGDSQGAASAHAGAPMVGGAFTTVLFDAIAVDTHGGFDLKSGIFAAPQDGEYLIDATLRIADGDIAGASYGIGVGTANADSPGFFWTEGLAKRQDATVQRLLTLKAGDPVRLFYYFDGTPPAYTAAEMAVARIR